MDIYSKLCAIQYALNAPKSQYNKFGGYSYRKAEDILEAVKPLLKQHGCVLTCSDELVLIGERYYVKAIASIIDNETGDCLSTTAYAREEQDKKGMDQSQITGASSSYARKYALNGLLCIDDSQDSDTTNTGDGKIKTNPNPAPVAPAEKKAVEKTATIDDAIKEATEAKTGKELTAVWAKYKEQFGLDSSFVLAISKNPANPKKRG